MEDYKSNSRISKEQNQPIPEKKIEKTITGTAKIKKKNEIQKFANTFISEDISNVKSYILLEVLVPAFKKAISDIVTNGIDMMLYGEAGRSTSSKSTASKVSYRNFYKRDDERDYRSRNSVGTRNVHDYDDIVIETRGEAEEVLTKMDELIDTYKMVSVGDLYDLVGITGKYTDEKYGWTDIRSASIVRVRDGYLLKLPKVMPL